MTDQPHNPNPLNPPTDEMRHYWAALGRFVHEFARIERMLFLCLGRFAGVPIPIGQAVFSGTRVDAAVSLIYRILDATKADDATRADLKTVFDQLRAVTDARNLILHYGTIFKPGTEYVASNRLVALDEARTRELPVSADKLDAMTADLDKMGAHLMVHECRGWVPDEVLEKITGERRRAAWRYTPPPPAPRDRKPPSTTPGQ